ncbi:hypothetical protein BD410DRAFT_788042 [Rickenella mellea]|uniref:Calcineurin-like phosphoesterase domain-containing protein n=1 Tax=Rickenella mellea TaxID=50990 RepID=A0A4Y7Q770_9AGAM|nr:hypothetical protein BD410DRAFT_788042 [Rickenella mellea]
MTAFAAKMQHKRLSTKKGSALGEFIVLDQTRYDLTPNITILGCTLWSHIPPGAADTVRLLLNDFKRITGNWNVETHNAAHLSDAEWLDAQCALIKNEEPGRRVVIFTHHAPMIEGTSKPAHSHSDLNTAFATDMTGRACWDEGTPVKVWAFGHTHFNCDFVKNGVRVVSNQRGYEAVESPRTGFQEDFVLNV